jgi:hypothetical protein
MPTLNSETAIVEAAKRTVTVIAIEITSSKRVKAFAGRCN